MVQARALRVQPRDLERLSTMANFLYYDPQQIELTERWLEAQPSVAPVTLLTDKASPEAVQRLQSQFPIIQEAIPLPEQGTLAGAEDRPVALPLPHYSIPLQFKPHLPLPEISPYYPLFQKLWHAGFRKFETYSIAGSKNLAIPHLLDAFKDRHKGERCFVVGNGPSLNELDMTLLKDEITLGSNRCYLGFERFGSPFKYWGIQDNYQIQEYSREYETSLPHDLPKFFPFEYLPLLRFENACPVNITWPREAPHQFSSDPAAIYSGFTVTYMLIQIAAVMGCDPIILIGTDHKYGIKPQSFLARKRRQLRRWASRVTRDTLLYNIARAAKFEKAKAASRSGRAATPQFWSAEDAGQPTHFDTSYTQSSPDSAQAKRFLVPEPELAEADFKCAANWAKENGVRILNATPGSALSVFPFQDYQELF